MNPLLWLVVYILLFAVINVSLVLYFDKNKMVVFKKIENTPVNGFFVGAIMMIISLAVVCVVAYFVGFNHFRVN